MKYTIGTVRCPVTPYLTS